MKNLYKTIDNFYKHYTLYDLIKEVELDLPDLHRYDAQHYEDWFSHVYPIENLVIASDTDPYCQFILSKGEQLEQRLKRWLNSMTTKQK